MTSLKLLFYALQKWHPDKKKDEGATSKFQEINEAYHGLCSLVI